MKKIVPLNRFATNLGADDDITNLLLISGFIC